MENITFRKPYFRWLFAGLGFHNSEATMTKLMPEQFKYQRVLKTFREISPTISRVFAGYHDWTRNAMDEFAGYYEQTFKKSDCSLYVVPGRMPFHETHDEMAQYVNEVAERLEYCVKDLDLRLIRYYCVTNELSVDSTYAQLSGDLNKFKEYNHLLRQAFRRRGLDIGLVATDSSGIPNFKHIDWAAANMDEYVDTYCTHNYDINNLPYDSPDFYPYLCNAYAGVVKTALKKEKRYMLGEFGIHNESHCGSAVMVDDVYAGFNVPQREAEYALMAAVEALAAMNSGALAAIFWTMCDYPDPFLRDNGHSVAAENRHEAARFSGHGISVRYNKNGLFRWSEDGDYSPRAYLYTIGLMAKFFRKNARLLEAVWDDPYLVCGGVTNADGSLTLCIINLSDASKEASLKVEHPIQKPCRLYRYECDHPPINEFGDLQGFEMFSGSTITLPQHSLALLTTCCTDRVPASVKGISVTQNAISWNACGDTEHCYYRVYEDGRQIASTAAESIDYAVKPNSSYAVRSVDRYGNEGQ